MSLTLGLVLASLLLLALGLSMYQVALWKDIERTRVRCPQCRAEGRQSTIQKRGSTVTMLGWTPFYDERGVYHEHNPNAYSTEYVCSNGHQWALSRWMPCPTCGPRHE